MIKKCILFGLINLLFFTYGFGQSKAKETFSNYFPMEIGNEWNYVWVAANHGEEYSDKVIDTIAIDHKKYILIEKGNIHYAPTFDTVRQDDKGRVWKFDNGIEQIWLDFSSDSVYKYIKYYSDNPNDTLDVHIEKYYSRKIGMFEYDSCISFWFNEPIIVDEEQCYTFAPEIGLVHIQMEGPTAPSIELNSAVANKKHLDTRNDFFPFQVDNQWLFTTEHTSNYSYKITDSLYIDDKLHYIFEEDTIRKDCFGRIWRYEDGFEQIWLDFSAPEDSNWTYIESNWGEILNYSYSIQRNLSINSYFGKIDSCINIYCDTEDVTDKEKSYLFSPNFGLIQESWWNNIAFVYQASVNDSLIKDKIEYFSIERQEDSTLIIGQCSPANMYLQLKEVPFENDSILIHWYPPDNNQIMSSLAAGFAINDLRNIKKYEIWLEPIKMPTWSNFTTTQKVKFDTLYECVNGTFKLTLKVFHSYNLTDSIYQFFKGISYMAIDDKILPNTYHLAQNYPNPFNPTTSITYTLPKKSHVKITIYDLSGRLVEKLVDAEKITGTHQVNWHAGKYASGLYFYKIEAGNFVDFKKCLLVK